MFSVRYLITCNSLSDRNPNYEGPNSTWETTNLSNLKYIDIGNEFKMVPGRIHENRLKFWEDLYAKYSHAY